MFAWISFFVSLTNDTRNRCSISKKPGFPWDFFFRLFNKTRKDPIYCRVSPLGFPRRMASNQSLIQSTRDSLPFLCLSIGQTTFLKRCPCAENPAIYRFFFFRLF
jgi:hypothetical protein